MKSKNIIITAAVAIFLIIGMVVVVEAYQKSQRTKQASSFKAKVYMGYYASSIMADNIVTVLDGYSKGARYYDSGHGTMNYSTGTYCYEPREAVALVLEQYNNLKVPTAIDTYMDAAYDKLPKGDEGLQRLYDTARKLQRLATAPRGIYTYSVEVGDTKASFLQVLDESDTDQPDTKIDRKALEEEALRFMRTLGGI
ncbi:MAG: hypothetical protein IJS97_06310 [Prevotella sp.]|nr:hypothetical protein [Prevotella sp.]